VPEDDQVSLSLDGDVLHQVPCGDGVVVLVKTHGRIIIGLRDNGLAGIEAELRDGIQEEVLFRRHFQHSLVATLDFVRFPIIKAGSEQLAVKRLDVRDMDNRDKKVSSGVAHKVLHKPFLMQSFALKRLWKAYDNVKFNFITTLLSGDFIVLLCIINLLYLI